MLSLPATVVTPRISSSGEPRARMRARPSSAGGMTKSVSKMTLCGAGAAARTAGPPNDSTVSRANGSLMRDTICAPSGRGQPDSPDRQAGNRGLRWVGLATMRETTRIASLAAALLVALASMAPATDVHDTRLLSDPAISRSEEHTSELQSRVDLVCRL